MEEKKSKKGIIILSFILILALAGVAVLGYSTYQMYNNKTQLENQVEELSKELEASQNTINELSNQENTTSNTSTTSNSSSNLSSASRNVSLKNGTYVVQDVIPDPENYGIESITLSYDDEFTVSLPLGTSYSGQYEIEDNKLICNAQKETNLEGGGSSHNLVDYTFEFEIVDDENLVLTESTDDFVTYTIGATYTLE